MTERVVTAPAETPVTLAEAKLHLREDFDDNDALITLLIGAATKHFQNNTARRLITQTLEWVRDDWRCEMRLPVAPVDPSSVTIQYADPETGDLIDLPADVYRVVPSGEGVRIKLRLGQSYPLLSDDAGERVVIRFTAGQAAAEIDPDIKAAILLMIGHWYQNREAVMTAQVYVLPLGVEAIVIGHAWE